jgi:alpha-amylase
MNQQKFLRHLFSVMVILLFLPGCVTPATRITPTSFKMLSPVPPTATMTPVPPTETITAIPSPTVTLLKPGEKIGQMSVDTSLSYINSWLDYCAPSFSDKPGGETINCTMPLLPEFEIGVAVGARDAILLDSNWKSCTWELFVDGQPIDLNDFNTFDVDWQMEDGTLVKLRLWNVKLVNASEGEHVVRYVIHINQEIDNGFEVIQPSTLQAVVNLTLNSSTASLTATPVRTPLPVQEEWWNKTVFYEIFVRSFADSTSGPLANDGIGDLQGLIEKLDYLNDGDPATSDDLGVTGLWLMPIMQSPSYHGYDVTDYYTVNKDYGTIADFKRLLVEAHKRGIQVIVDLVINHTSSEHPWFIEARDHPESEKRAWYLWSQDKPDYLGPWGQEVWHPSPSGYYYGLFWSGMPDLNLTNPQVTAEMGKITRFWLEDIGVDGFRLDGARHLIEEGSVQENTAATHDWWKRYRPVVKAANPEALAIGEIWSNDSSVVTYLQGDELDLAFDFDLAANILKDVTLRAANRIHSALASSYSLFGSSRSATFLTNHDINRVMNQLGNDLAKAKLAASVLLTAPGVPFVYYGEEIGMTGVKPDEMIRTPMQWSSEANAGFTTGAPWEPVNADYQEKNVASQLQDPASLLSFYRDLIQIRSKHSALQVGEFLPVDSQDTDILAFLRESDEEIVLVIINLGEDKAVDYDLTLKEGNLAGTYQAVLLYGGQVGLTQLSASSQGGFDAYLPLPEISGNGVVIIQLSPLP